MDKLRGKNVTFLCRTNLMSIQLIWKCGIWALGELEKQNRKTIKEALNNLIKQ